MIYAVSDLHGIPLEKIQNSLKKLPLGQDDTLYVLGDVIDRGQDGIRILKWIMTQPNIKFIMGNHEHMMLMCEEIFEGDINENIYNLRGFTLKRYSMWTTNGGDETVETLRTMREEDMRHIFDFLRDAPFYKRLNVGGKEFLLTHSGIDNFSPEKPLEKYTHHDFLWNRPYLEDKYYDGIMTVFGHTPTFVFGKQYEQQIIQTRTWIDIDTGAAYGRAPAILRLDDLKCFYIR